MLENPTQAAATADSVPNVVRRYAPPNQRNRSLNRRKSGDRFDRTGNYYGNDGEKNQLATSRNTPVMDHGDTGSSNLSKYSQPKLISLEGFSKSEGAQLLKDRGRAIWNLYHDPSVDLSERPVLYSSGVGPWGVVKLPHQMLSPTNSTGPTSGTQMDFLAELCRKMQASGATFDN